MKLVTYRKPTGDLHVGELKDDGSVYSLNGATRMVDVIERWENIDTTESYRVMQEVTIAAPLIPGKIMAVGRNYAEHAAELGNERPASPLIFSKYPSCVIGTNEAIRWKTSITGQVDYEGELAVVIGKRAQNVSEAEALEYVFGYTLGNDVSARDLQDSESQWVRAKAQDTFLPLGPCIVTRDAIADPHDLKLKTTLNDTVMQDGHTGDMIFNIPYLVSYLSQTFTLEPGDVILTGTPSGVGKAQKPPRFLNAGDVVSITVPEIGTLTNPCQPE